MFRASCKLTVLKDICDYAICLELTDTRDLELFCIRHKLKNSYELYHKLKKLAFELYGY